MVHRAYRHPATNEDGHQTTDQFNLENLRLIGSVGEPLHAEAVLWGKKTFGMPILDNWWQTETGGIMIANFSL